MTRRIMGLQSSMSDLFFVRHGQASFGTDNYDRLSETGVFQAGILGRHLAARNVVFDTVYTGDMERQKETARHVRAAYLEKGISFPEPLVDPAWNEIDSTRVWDAQVRRILEDDPGFLDAHKQDPGNKKTFQAVFSTVMNQWVSGGFDGPGDITWNGFKQQVIQGLTPLCDTGGASKKIAVFTSGGPISVAVQAALDISDQKTLDLLWQVMNASVTRLKCGGQRISLSGFNDITPLEMMNDRTLLTYR